MSQGMKNNRVYIYAKTLAVGLIITGLASFWLYTSISGAWQDLMLMQDHKTCSGFIVDTWEEIEGESDAGQDMWYYGYIYTYRLPDEQEFSQTMSHSGRLKPEFRGLSEPYPIEVEYLSGNPTVSRIKGDGPNTIPSWIRASVGYYAFIPLILLVIGLYLLWQEVSELRELRKSEKFKAYGNGAL